MTRKTEKCEQCKHHDPDWEKYSQLVTCRHPKILECNDGPIWALYPLEGFCRRYDAFEPLTNPTPDIQEGE